MKTLVYETKVDSRAALRDRIFAAVEHNRNHPNNIASAAHSLLIACRKLHCSWLRTLKTITVKQVLILVELCSSLIPECAFSHVTSPLGNLMYSAWKPKDNYDISASVVVVQFNGFMSLTS